MLGMTWGFIAIKKLKIIIIKKQTNIKSPTDSVLNTKSEKLITHGIM